MNILLERLTYWPVVHSVLWSVSKFLKWNIQSLAKYLKKNYAGFSGNNIAKFIDYQILADTLIIKVEKNEKHKCHSFYWYSISGRGVINICLAPGPYTNLNLTCAYLIKQKCQDFWITCPRSVVPICTFLGLYEVYHSGWKNRCS